jgi:tight adherence protein B
MAAWVALRPSCRASPTRGEHNAAVWLLPAVFVVALTCAALAPQRAALVFVAAGTAWGGHALRRQRAVARSAVEVRDRVLECCDLLVGELAAGQPAVAALERAAQAFPPLGPIAQAATYGGDVPAAWRRAADEAGAEGLVLVAAAWQVSDRTGHGLAEALGRVAHALREARATDRVVHGELASARATARLVAALPVVALAIGAGSGGDPLGFLLGTPLGLACLAGGLGLGLAGLTWIERIAAAIGR